MKYYGILYSFDHLCKQSAVQMHHLYVPTEKMVLYQHVAHTIFEGLIIRVFLDGKFPIWIQIERQLRQNTQITFYLDPTGTVDKRPLMIPSEISVVKQKDLFIYLMRFTISARLHCKSTKPPTTNVAPVHSSLGK